VETDKMMQNRIEQDDPLSMTERILGALMAFILSGLSAICIPLLLFWKFPVSFGLSLGLASIFLFPGVCLWGSVVAVVSLRIGFNAGIYDTMDVFNVMWRTGENHDPKVHEKAVQIKKIIFLSAMVTLVFLFLG
jgi:hypothetical protein